MKVKGTDLSNKVKREVLAAFIYRNTGDHPSEDASLPLHFSTDAEWLANTFFDVNKDGSLNKRCRFCESHPTWPNNPELRHEK